MTPAAPRARRAVAALLASTALWAVSFPLLRALSLAQRARAPAVSSWFMACAVVALRFGLAAALVAALAPRALRRVTRSELTQGVGLGLLCGAGIPWQVDGLAHTDASVSAFISQAYCVWIPLSVCLATRRLPAPRLAASVALAALGIMALSGVDRAGVRLGRGEAETLVASLLCTAQILWLERPRFAANRSATVTALMFAVTALVVAPAAALAAGGPAPWVALLRLPRFVESVAVLAVACTAAPFLLMNHFQRRVTATEAGIIYCAEPMFACALALFAPAALATWMASPYENEPASARLLVGGALVTVANLWAQRGARGEAVDPPGGEPRAVGARAATPRARPRRGPPTAAAPSPTSTPSASRAP